MQTFRFGQPVEILQSDGWHPAIYAICHESWCTHEVLAECDPRSLIEVGNGYIRPLPDEPMPIRRGDVVQQFYDDVSVTGVVIRDPEPESITIQPYDRGMHYVASPDRCVRIGRAKFYPDGTPVEG